MNITSYTLQATVPYDENSMELVLGACEKVIANMTCIEATAFKANFAVQELLVNALEHGYKKCRGEIFILLKNSVDSLMIEIIDRGSGINASNLRLNREVKTPDDIGERGWGLSILYNLASKIEILPNLPSGAIIRLYISS